MSRLLAIECGSRNRRSTKTYLTQNDEPWQRKSCFPVACMVYILYFVFIINFMKAQSCIKKLFIFLFFVLTASTANSQSSGQVTYDLLKLDGIYKYSTAEVDAKQLKINKINYLSNETKYLLEQSGRNNQWSKNIQSDEDYKNYTKMISYATRTKNIDSVEKILDFISFDVKANYLDLSATDSLIEVTVKVVNDSTKEELSGYNVFAKPSMSVDRADVIPFNPTKNAKKKIRPGKKCFWIEKNNIKIDEIDEWPLSISDDNTHLVIFTIKK